MNKKITLYDEHGNEKGKVELPSVFHEKIRGDIVGKVLEAKKTRQPYAPSLVGGKQNSASGKMRHRRHVWQTHYGKGMSRIPRKVMSRRGTQFNWVGAEISSTRGGRRAHPPKVQTMMKEKRINKKELNIALISALSATANEAKVIGKYKRLENKKIKELPFIVESKILNIKTKKLFESLKKILGKDLFEIAIKKKSLRSGKGKGRGRKYKANSGVLFVISKEDRPKTKAFDIVNVNNLSVKDVAKGGLGRLTVYTEKAIKEIGERFK